MHDPISGNALITIVLKEKLLYYLKYCIVLLPRSPRWGGGGTPHMKGVGILVENFELNP